MLLKLRILRRCHGGMKQEAHRSGVDNLLPPTYKQLPKYSWLLKVRPLGD